MNRKLIVAGLIITALLALAFLSLQVPQTPSGDFFVVDVLGERFVIHVTDPETVSLANENLEGKNKLFPSGQLARGDGGFNKPWSWYLKPETVRMVEVSIEVCDGTPSFVEKELDYWFGTVKSYCPWAGRIVAVGRDLGASPPVKSPSP